MDLPSVAADPQLKAAFESLRGLTEVQDDDGRVVGFLLPGVPRKHLRVYLKALAGYDPEEMDRRRREPGPLRTTQELLAHLKELERREALLYESAAAHFDRAEMERRAQTGPHGRTTTEVLSRLQAAVIPRD